MSAETERRIIRWAILGLVAYSIFGRRARAGRTENRLRDATGGDPSSVIGTNSGKAANLG